MTPEGGAPLDAAYAWQDSLFGSPTDDWTDAERAGFRRAMLRLLDRSRQLAVDNGRIL